MLEISFKITISDLLTLLASHSNCTEIVIQLFGDFKRSSVTRPSLISFGIDKLFKCLLGITELKTFHSSFGLFLYLVMVELYYIFLDRVFTRVSLLEFVLKN